MHAKFLLAAFMLPLLASAALAQGNAEYGKEEFEAKCSKCHAVDAAAGAGTGPNLHGILGKTAGTQAGYAFSDAVKNSAVTWSEETLSRFIQNPAAVIPGNRMAASYPGTTAEIAADIVAYIKSTAPAQ